MLPEWTLVARIGESVVMCTYKTLAIAKFVLEPSFTKSFH